MLLAGWAAGCVGWLGGPPPQAAGTPARTATYGDVAQIPSRPKTPDDSAERAALVSTLKDDKARTQAAAQALAVEAAAETPPPSPEPQQHSKP